MKEYIIFMMDNQQKKYDHVRETQLKDNTFSMWFTTGGFITINLSNVKSIQAVETIFTRDTGSNKTSVFMGDVIE